MKSKVHICIVTPGALGSNPRAVKEAHALYEAGYDVTVLSTRTLELVDAFDDDVLKSAAWKSRRINLGKQNKWRFFRTIQAANGLLFRLTGLSYFAEWGFSAFTLPLYRAALEIRADLYIAHYPAALPAAAMAAKRYSGLLAYDAEDFFLGDYADVPEFTVTRSMIHVIEERYIFGCAYVTAASPGIASAYVNVYGIKLPEVVLNVFPLADAPANATAAGVVIPGPSVYWFSQTIGPDRGLECAIKAIGRARSRPHLYMRGTLAEGFRERIELIAGAAGAVGRCHIWPPDVPSKMVMLACAYDVGLVGETGKSRNRQIALTNKQFTYFLAGLPAVMSDVPANCQLAQEVGIAAAIYTADDYESLAASLDRIFENPFELAAARHEAFRLGQERFNWDVEKTVVLTCVADALAGRSG